MTQEIVLTEMIEYMKYQLKLLQMYVVPFEITRSHRYYKKKKQLVTPLYRWLIQVQKQKSNKVEVIMKTTFRVREEDQFIVLLNNGFSINPQNIAKMESIKEKIESYFDTHEAKTLSNSFPNEEKKEKQR